MLLNKKGTQGGVLEFILLGLLGFLAFTKKELNIKKVLDLNMIKFIPSPNFVKRKHRGVDTIVIHITQGSFASAISWFKMKRSKVSAHYLVSKKGDLVQMVQNQNVAWHAAPFNTRSIGIEHEGYYDYKGKTTNFTPEQYLASAKLVNALCLKYQIPKTRQHIIGHREVPRVKKSCPGYNWDWDYYMNLLRGL